VQKALYDTLTSTIAIHWQPHAGPNHYEAVMADIASRFPARAATRLRPAKSPRRPSGARRLSRAGTDPLRVATEPSWTASKFAETSWLASKADGHTRWGLLRFQLSSRELTAVERDKRKGGIRQALSSRCIHQAISSQESRQPKSQVERDDRSCSSDLSFLRRSSDLSQRLSFLRRSSWLVSKPSESGGARRPSELFSPNGSPSDGATPDHSFNSSTHSPTAAETSILVPAPVPKPAPTSRPDEVELASMPRGMQASTSFDIRPETAEPLPRPRSVQDSTQPTTFDIRPDNAVPLPRPRAVAERRRSEDMQDEIRLSCRRGSREAPPTRRGSREPSPVSQRPSGRRSHEPPPWFANPRESVGRLSGRMKSSRSQTNS